MQNRFENNFPVELCFKIAKYLTAKDALAFAVALQSFTRQSRYRLSLFSDDRQILWKKRLFEDYSYTYKKSHALTPEEIFIELKCKALAVRATQLEIFITSKAAVDPRLLSEEQERELRASVNDAFKLEQLLIGQQFKSEFDDLHASVNNIVQLLLYATENNPLIKLMQCRQAEDLATLQYQDLSSVMAINLEQFLKLAFNLDLKLILNKAAVESASDWQKINETVHYGFLVLQHFLHVCLDKKLFQLINLLCHSNPLIEHLAWRFQAKHYSLLQLAVEHQWLAAVELLITKQPNISLATHLLCAVQIAFLLRNNERPCTHEDIAVSEGIILLLEKHWANPCEAIDKISAHDWLRKKLNQLNCIRDDQQGELRAWAAATLSRWQALVPKKTPVQQCAELVTVVRRNF